MQGTIKSMCSGVDADWLAVAYSGGTVAVIDMRTGLISSSKRIHEGEITKVQQICGYVPI